MSKKYLDSAGLNKFASMVLSKFAAKNHSHSSATTNSAGFMSANDKVKLDGVSAGANKTIVDSTLSSTSVNAIQNKAVKTALDGKAASSHTHPTAQITGLDSALAGKASASHNHSADNITSGVLPVGRGGTGSTNSVGAASTMLNALERGEAAPRDDDWYVAKYAEDGNDTPVRRTHSALWSYIKAKCDGLYQPRGSYASSSHTHTIANVSNLQSTLDSKASVSHTHSNATATASGFMSNTDKSKLDGVSTGANKTIVDASFSATSTNPVQNKVVKAALDAKASSSHTHTTSQVSGLDAALAGKASTSHNHNGVYAPVSHNHDAGNITSGVLPIGRGGTGGNSTTSAAASLKYYSLSGKTSIPENADLNTYKTAGVYACTSDAVCKTIKNCPTGGISFSLEVDYVILTPMYLIQTLRQYNNAKVYRRYSVDAGATWSAWQSLVMSNDTIPIQHGGTGATTAARAVANLFPNVGNLGYVATIGSDWSGGYRSYNDLINDTWSIIKSKTDPLYQPKGSYATSSHNHSAANITSGTLPIARGGTGTTSANGIRSAIGINPVTTGGTGAAYTASVSGITSLATGASFIMVPHVTSTSTSPTLNVNGLGAKNIRQRLSGSSSATTVGASASWLIAGKAVQVAYDGAFWVVDFTRPDLSNAYGTLPVSKGGTGATNAGTARTNLGINTINLYNNENNTSGHISSTSLLEFTDSKIDYLIVTVKYSTPSLNSTSSSTFIVPHCQFGKSVSFMVAGDHSNCPMIGVLFGAFSGSDFYPSAQKQYNGSIVSQISNYIAIINVDAVLNQPL